VELNAGAQALDYARRYVRTLERGPDYDIPMLRSILSRSKGAIVHSAAVEGELRKHGFSEPVAKIPHGAWIVEADRMAYRARLGLPERAPLVGIFGFLKPYKRIAESLRAFRRLVKLTPEARMILVGEAHPELPLHSMIASLGLSPHVRHLDFVPIEHFNGYLAACDIVLNLRHPTVGESSGTLLRALGMGKAVIVSNVGAFREYPDEICLKAPVDDSEEDHLFELLNLLTSRPEIAQALGAGARRWVERECRWESVARQYAAFVESVVNGGRQPAAQETSFREKGEEQPAEEDAAASTEQGRESGTQEPDGRATPDDPAIPAVEVPGEYIAGWAPVVDGSRKYVESHLTRLEKTLAMTPPGSPGDRALEMGAYFQITPALKTRLGYEEVRGCYYGKLGESKTRAVTSDGGETFECTVELFDAEKDRFPYPDEYFATVLCCELLEHLSSDPMHMMAEIHRILRPGGHMVLTTPNITSLRAVSGILQGYHPALFPAYLKPAQGGETDARHNREYTPGEIGRLLDDAGFLVTLLDTGPFREEPKPELGWVEHLLDRYMLLKEHRGDGIYAVGRKIRPVRNRYPSWLYA